MYTFKTWHSYDPNALGLLENKLRALIILTKIMEVYSRRCLLESLEKITQFKLVLILPELTLMIEFVVHHVTIVPFVQKI